MPPPPGSRRSSVVRILWVGCTAAAVQAISAAGFTVSVAMRKDTLRPHDKVVVHLSDPDGGPGRILGGVAFLDTRHVAGQRYFPIIDPERDPGRVQIRVPAKR